MNRGSVVARISACCCLSLVSGLAAAPAAFADNDCVGSYPVTAPWMTPAWVYEYDPTSIGYVDPPALCFDAAQRPSDAVIAEIERSVYQSLLRYNLQGNRWPSASGAPVQLTWSFIPDGTQIPPGFNGDNGNVTAPSNLFAQMDAKFGGNRALWIAQFQAAFDRWSALTGTSYVRVTSGGNPWDDGAAFPASASSANRGDLRIGGRNIDGGSNVLAYNYFPTTGDMVLDTSESWASSSQSYIFLRNTLTHEHGHGLGLAHVCPSNGSKLMEPFLNTGFDGPQHDDLRGVDNLYGDAYESNNSAASATVLGALAPAASVTPSAVPAPAITNGSLTSLDINGDEDWFRLSLAAGNNISVTATPVGLTYDASTQNSNGTCNSGSNFNSLTAAPISVQLLGSNGTTVLGTNAAAAGSSAALSNIAVPAGNFYVRVFEGGAPTQSQLYTVTVSAGAIPAPGNDLCANAQFISFGSISASNVGAQADGGDSCRGNANLDIWYQIVPPCTGTMTIDTCGAPLDTVVSVHSACPGTTVNQLACNDDNGGAGPCPGGLTSYLTVPVTAGTNYKIRVAGFNGATGNFTLNVGFQGPANDACASAVPIAGGGTASGFTCGATNDYSGASCGASQASPDVWYSFTPTCSGPISMNTCGSNYDTVLGLYSGTCGSLSEVACNDDAGAACPSNTVASIISANVTAGTAYLIRVSGFAGSVGNYTLNVGNVTVANDLCADATTVTSGVYTGSTCAAGRDGGDTCRSTATAGDVWYRWVAPCTGNLVLNTCGSSYDTDISVHTACPGNAGNQIACNDDNGGAGPCPGGLNSFLSTPVTGGAAYLIRVSGFAANVGSYVLSIAQQPNDLCQDALVAAAGVTPFSTLCANVDGTATCGTSTASPDVWFNHTPSCTGPLWIDLCGSTYDTVVSLETGACGSLTEVACNDDQGARCAVNTLHSFIATRVVAGTTYKIRVSGFNGASGTGTMKIQCCIGDFNLSGAVSVQDIFDFLAAYFANDPRADVNASGAISVQDIFDFLQAYFSGCP